MNISLEEFRAVGSRVALYTAVAYVTIRAVRFVTSKAAALVGMDDKNSCC